MTKPKELDASTLSPDKDKVVSDLARRIRSLFEKRLKLSSSPDEVEARMRVMLRAEENQDLDIDLFEKRLMELEPFLDDPSRLLGKAVEKINLLIIERGDSAWLDKDVCFLAANLVAKDFELLKREDTLIIPNPWYLDLPRYVGASFYENGRLEENVIQPADMSMYEWIRQLTEEKDGVVEVLDIGPGDGKRLKELKGAFGEKILTTSVGLVNQEIPADNNWVGPMEIMPMTFADKFDVVMSNWAMIYSSFPKRALGEAMRVLRPGRKAFLSVSLVFKESAINSSTPYALLGMSRDQYFQKIEKEGIGDGSLGGLKKIVEEEGGGSGYIVKEARGNDCGGIPFEIEKLES